MELFQVDVAVLIYGGRFQANIAGVVFLLQAQEKAFKIDRALARMEISAFAIDAQGTAKILNMHVTYSVLPEPGLLENHM